MSRVFEALPTNLSVTDRVFEAVQAKILSLELVPGARLSEADVARQFGISRQPVRDAFHRLSKLGFLVIRPQRATEVSLISPEAILAARFLRTASEIEMARRAARLITAPQVKALRDLIEDQKRAITTGDSDGFKTLDDAFHRTICGICGLEAVWDNIAESKAHTDRLRLLSIRDSSGEALQDHHDILAALEAGDADAASDRMRRHLDRIKSVLEDLRATQSEWFTAEDRR